MSYVAKFVFFFFQAEDGIRDKLVTGVQTCALPISWATMLVRAWPCVALPWRGPRPPPGMPTWPTSAGRHATARPAVQPLAPLCIDEPPRTIIDGRVVA